METVAGVETFGADRARGRAGCFVTSISPLSQRILAAGTAVDVRHEHCTNFKAYVNSNPPSAQKSSVFTLIRLCIGKHLFVEAIGAYFKSRRVFRVPGSIYLCPEVELRRSSIQLEKHVARHSSEKHNKDGHTSSVSPFAGTEVGYGGTKGRQ